MAGVRESLRSYSVIFLFLDGECLFARYLVEQELSFECLYLMLDDRQVRESVDILASLLLYSFCTLTDRFDLGDGAEVYCADGPG